MVTVNFEVESAKATLVAKKLNFLLKLHAEMVESEILTK
jgi:hypothetical protein